MVYLFMFPSCRPSRVPNYLLLANKLHDFFFPFSRAIYPLFSVLSKGPPRHHLIIPILAEIPITDSQEIGIVGKLHRSKSRLPTQVANFSLEVEDCGNLGIWHTRGFFYIKDICSSIGFIFEYNQ